MPDPGTVRSYRPTVTATRPVTDSEQAGLLHALSAVSDPRSRRGLRYPLAGLLAVAVCAVMGGASSIAAIADWLHDLDDIARAVASWPKAAARFRWQTAGVERRPSSYSVIAFFGLPVVSQHFAR